MVGVRCVGRGGGGGGLVVVVAVLIDGVVTAGSYRGSQTRAITLTQVPHMPAPADPSTYITKFKSNLETSELYCSSFASSQVYHNNTFSSSFKACLKCELCV